MDKKKHRINVTFDEETFQQILNISRRDNISMSEVVRNAALDSITTQVNKENIDQITQIIRTQLRDVLQPSVDRLAALSAKTCVQSATAAYLSAEAINRFVPPSQQEDVASTYEMARRKAVRYTKNRIDLNEGDEQDAT